MKKISGKTKFIFLNLIAAVLVFLGVGFYVLSRLDAYTRHGYSIAVPSFYGMTPEEALEVADYDHLRIQVVDSLYDESEQPGTVLEQYPAEGARVKENRLIHLTINAKNPEKVIFPNLKNAAYRQTLQTLQARGFAIGRIEYVPAEFKNLVLTFKQEGKEILPGAMLRKGSRIDIVLGDGNGSNRVYAPLLTGKSLAEAVDIVRGAYLNIGEIVPDGSIRHKGEYAGAVVYQQYPPFNSLVNAAAPVDLYITLQREKIAALDSLIITE